VACFFLFQIFSNFILSNIVTIKIKEVNERYGNMKTLEIRVRGLVQGVYFRQSTQETATSLGITGWVRNEADGSVMINASGDEGSLNKFLKWCKIGPREAIVNDIGQREIEKTNYDGFRII
jgi:acylphosphatase